MIDSKRKVLIKKLTTLLRIVKFPKPRESTTIAFEDEMVTKIVLCNYDHADKSICYQVHIFGLTKDDKEKLNSYSNER